MRFCSFWMYGGKVIVPSIARTPSGLTVEVDPVAIVPTEEQAILEVLLERLSTPAGASPDYSRSEWPEPVVVKAAGAKSWSAFARKASGVSLDETEQGWTIYMGPGGDEAEKVVLPPDTDASGLARRLLDGMLQYAK